MTDDPMIERQWTKADLDHEDGVANQSFDYAALPRILAAPTANRFYLQLFADGSSGIAFGQTGVIIEKDQSLRPYAEPIGVMKLEKGILEDLIATAQRLLDEKKEQG